MPFSSPVFRKLFLSALLLTATTLVVLDFYLTRYTARRQVESVQQQLAAEARILAGELTAVAPPGVEEWAHNAETRAQARITVIGPDGVVLADSGHDPETMENHRDRPEVQAALRGAAGASVRHSATLGRDLCYVALPSTYLGRSGFVLRLALPLREIDVLIAAVRGRILAASAVAAILALGMAYVFSRRFTRRLSRIQRFAAGLVKARFSESLEPETDDEFGALAESLNHMARQLRDFLDQLSVESARRDAILASMVEGVLAVDNELRVIFCNPSFARAVGAHWPVAEQVPVLQLVRDPAFLDLLNRAVATDQTVKQRLQLGAAGGRVFELQAAPLAAGPRRGAIAVLYDVTDLERLERIRKDFVANVSHELRTPLTAIRGYAETLLDGALEDPENNRKFLETIRAHAIRLNNIASDLLTLSELESGQPDINAEPVSIRGAIEAALRTIEAEARTREVTVHRGDIEDFQVMGHKIRLEQAFVNLLDNAVKFNHSGGEVWIETGRAPDGTVRVTISDTGVGIPSEDLPRIFERFYRVDKARSRKVGGTGLGLSIVKHTVERMGGAVSVTSHLGKGSVFTVSLPPA